MTFLDKITSRPAVAARVKTLPQPVVFTNGVFDVLHAGHVTYLTQARSLVTWFDEDTPLEIINELRPQIIVKGGDYDMGKLKEAQLVESYGGKALALPFLEGYSTTALVAKIRSNS